MKRLFYILLFLIPVISFGQTTQKIATPTEYTKSLTASGELGIPGGAKLRYFGGTIQFWDGFNWSNLGSGSGGTTPGGGGLGSLGAGWGLLAGDGYLFIDSSKVPTFWRMYNSLSAYLGKLDTAWTNTYQRALNAQASSPILQYQNGLNKVGNTVNALYGSPIWNANMIQSRYITAATPLNGQTLMFDSIQNKYIWGYPDSLKMMDYYTKTEVQGLLDDTAAAIRADMAGGVDLSNYYDKTESDGRYLQSFTETDPTVDALIKAMPVSVDASTNKFYYWNNGSIGRRQIAYGDVSGTPDLSGYELLSNKSTSSALGTSNTLYPTQKAVKDYVDAAVAAMTSGVSSVYGRTGAVIAQEGDYSAFYPVLSGSYVNPSWIISLPWSKITGTPTTLGAYGITDAFNGDYNNLTNKPTIPAAQVNSDWNASSGVAQILNKPALAAVATSGDYNDLVNKPVASGIDSIKVVRDSLKSYKGATPTNVAKLAQFYYPTPPQTGDYLLYNQLDSTWRNHAYASSNDTSLKTLVINPSTKEQFWRTTSSSGGTSDSVRVFSGSFPSTGNVGINSSDNRMYYKVNNIWFKLSVTDSVDMNAYDTDATAYFTRVTSAGGALTSSEKTAFNNFVIAAKANGYFTKFKALYVYLGGVDASRKLNAINTSYTQTWTNVTFVTGAGGGVKGNGTSAYIQTGLIPSTQLTINSTMFGSWIVENTSAGVADFDARNSSTQAMTLVPRASDNFASGASYAEGTGNYAFLGVGSDGIGSTGMWGVIKNGTTLYLYRNGTLMHSLTPGTTGSLPNIEMYILARNNNGAGPNLFSSRTHKADYVAGGFTTTDWTNFNTDFSNFMTAIGR